MSSNKKNREKYDLVSKISKFFSVYYFIFFIIFYSYFKIYIHKIPANESSPRSYLICILRLREIF